jgi:hypothetical protein
MTKDEALDKALEALEKSVATCFDRCAHKQVMSRPEHFINQAITAIKQARSAQVQEPVAVYGYCPICGAEGVMRERRPNGYDKCAKNHTYPSSKATPPAQPAQKNDGAAKMPCGAVVSNVYDAYEAGKNAAQPAKVQEPVVRWDSDGWGDLLVDNLPDGTLLYTTPPAAQRPWVGLTDAEVMQTMSGDWTSQFYFARAIEAKLKEKNT